jgi:peptide deformylase
LALRIRTLGDPVLRERAHRVEGLDDEAADLIEAMGETLGAEPGRAGLAATQVGVLKRIFVYDLGLGPRCVINPEIFASSGEESNEEGCLSLPGLSVEVRRFRKVSVRCVTASGHNITIEAEDYPARLMQHECDHLDGILIIDRCDDEERKRALVAYQELELLRALPDES